MNATYDGLRLFDVSDPAAITPIANLVERAFEFSHSNWVAVAGGRKVSVHGGEGLGEHLKVIDVDPASPDYMTVLAEWETRPEVSIHNVMAFGDRAFVAYYEDGVRVLDISDPTEPVQVAYFNTWREDLDTGGTSGTFGIDVDVAAGLIYVADSPRPSSRRPRSHDPCAAPTRARSVTWTPSVYARSWYSVASSSDGTKLVAYAAGGRSTHAASGTLVAHTSSFVDITYIGGDTWFLTGVGGTVEAP